MGQGPAFSRLTNHKWTWEPLGSPGETLTAPRQALPLSSHPQPPGGVVHTQSRELVPLSQEDRQLVRCDPGFSDRPKLGNQS